MSYQYNIREMTDSEHEDLIIEYLNAIDDLHDRVLSYLDDDHLSDLIFREFQIIDDMFHFAFRQKNFTTIKVAYDIQKRCLDFSPYYNNDEIPAAFTETVREEIVRWSTKLADAMEDIEQLLKRRNDMYRVDMDIFLFANIEEMKSKHMIGSNEDVFSNDLHCTMSRYNNLNNQVIELESSDAVIRLESVEDARSALSRKFTIFSYRHKMPGSSFQEFKDECCHNLLKELGDNM